MADLAAADVTYTLVRETRTGGTRSARRMTWTLAFGDGVLTYPSGGVPLVKANLGCPNNVDLIQIIGQPASRLLWKINSSTLKLQAFYTTGGSATSPAGAEADPLIDAGATAVTGSAATGPFKPGRMKELASASSAPAATVIQVDVEGW